MRSDKLEMKLRPNGAEYGASLAWRIFPFSPFQYLRACHHIERFSFTALAFTGRSSCILGAGSVGRAAVLMSRVGGPGGYGARFLIR